MNYKSIVTEINHFIRNCPGTSFSDYYVGIAKDADRRLFIEHNVNKNTGCYIIKEAINIDNARYAEKLLLGQGLRGGDGGGDHNSVFVYCYYITNQTVE